MPVELSLASIKREPGSHRLCSGSGTGSQCWASLHQDRKYSFSHTKTAPPTPEPAQVHGVNRFRAGDGRGVPTELEPLFAQEARSFQALCEETLRLGSRASADPALRGKNLLTSSAEIPLSHNLPLPCIEGPEQWPLAFALQREVSGAGLSVEDGR